MYADGDSTKMCFQLLGIYLYITSLSARRTYFGALDGPQITELHVQLYWSTVVLGERYFGSNWSPSQTAIVGIFDQIYPKYFLLPAVFV